MSIATKKLTIKFGVGMVSKLSHPSGKPAATDGNGRWRIRRGRPDAVARLIVWRNLAAMRGVVMTVTVTPCCANNLAMSTMGMKWPGHIRGNRTK